MKTELEIYKEAMEHAKTAISHAITSTKGLLDGTSQRMERYMERIAAILNPPPEYEELTYERWECSHCGDVLKTAPSLDGHYDCCQAEDKVFIHLIGTFKRPKKRMVEKSVTYNVKWERHHGIVFPCMADFTDLENIHTLEGKTGVLTFTWPVSA